MKQCIVLIFLVFPFLNSPTGSRGDELFRSAAQQQKNGFSPCINEEDCDNFQNAICVDNFCECNGTKFCQDKMETKVTKLGQTCKTRGDCIIEHSVCVQEKCQCEQGRVGSEDGRRCFKVADSLGSTCTDSVQCYTKVPRSGCQHEKCACQQKTHEFNGTCFSDIGLGQNCSHIGDCAKTPFAVCAEDKCSCRPSHVANAASNKCLDIARRIHDPCYEDIQCSIIFGMAGCHRGFCKCQELYQFKMVRGICVRDLLLGETCDNHTDCQGREGDESRLECVLGECKCRASFVEEYGSCASTSDEPCIDSLLCNELDSEPKPEQCRVGRCECPEERPYCTNQAADTRSNRPIKEAPNKQSAKEKIVLEAAPEEGPNPFSFFQGDLYTAQSDSDSHRQGQSIDPSDQEELEALYTYTCYVTIYVLLMSSLLLVAFSKNRTRRFFSKYVLPFYGLVIVLCAMWIVNLRDEMFTVIVLVVLGGTSCALLNISYRIINDILNEGGRRLIEEGRSEDGPDEAQAEPEGRRRLSMRSRRRRHR